MILLFIGFVIVGAVGVFWLLLTAARRGEPTTDRNTGGLVFRHGRMFRVVAVAALVGLPIVIGLLFLTTPPKSSAGVVLFVLMGVVCVGFGVVLTRDAFRFQLTVTSAGVAGRMPWRGAVSIPWADVTAVTFSRGNVWFVVHANDRRAVRVSALVPGLTHFLDRCERQLDPERLTGAGPGYRWVNRPLPGRRK